MNQDYKTFSCIQAMSETDEERFYRIATAYAEKLNAVISNAGTIYTFHDFDHHCTNLYKIISDIILYKDRVFNTAEKPLTDKEIYLLNLAVLLHDLGMTKKIGLSRDRHPIDSAEMILKDYENPESSLTSKKSGLSRNDINALMLIVKAHSDIKNDPSVPECENGLRNSLLTNSMPSNPKKIKARFLANVLRLADELDITSDRLGDRSIEEALEKTIQEKELLIEKIAKSVPEEQKRLVEELKELDAAIHSNEHWEKLYLFSEVQRDSAGKVSLVVDDFYVKNQLKIGSSSEQLASRILSVKKKIVQEFQFFKNDVEKELSLSTLIGIKELSISTQILELQIAIDNLEKKTVCPQNRENEKRIVPQVLSEELERKISDYIEKKNLYEVGHFRLHDNLCSRDWIKVDEIIQTESFFRKYVTQLLLHMQEKIQLDDNYAIIGIDFSGMLIASKLAFVLEKPFSYVIPTYKKRSSSKRELEVTIQEYNNIVIVTDVIVTFETISRVIDEYNMHDRVKAIYGVLYRGTSVEQLKPEMKDLVACTYVFNNDFPIEIHDNSECRFKVGKKCKALNKIYD